MNAVSALTGSSPAYVYMFIEAMGDAGCYAGIPRQQAYELAAQAVLGSAKMVLESGKHPAQLKDEVCSPGGTTIRAVAQLEKDGMRSAVIEAIRSCVSSRACSGCFPANSRSWSRRATASSPAKAVRAENDGSSPAAVRWDTSPKLLVPCSRLTPSSGLP